MPTTKSAEKRVRQNAKRRRHNRSWKTKVKNARKAVNEAIEGGEDEETVQELAREALGLLDKVASKGIYHRNKSDRLKSRLQTRVNDYVS